MDTTITIRFVKKEEIPALVLLCEQHAIFEESAYNQENKAVLLRKHLFADISPLYCLVAEKAGELIGYATYMKQYSTWDAGFYIYMDCLFMNDKSRGFGVGERLMNRIKEEAVKMDCALIQWQTPDFNVRAIKFYERIGATSKSKERFYLKAN